MANQLKMAEVDTILTLHRHGWSARRIAREVGIHRETVARYLQGAAQPSSKPASAPSGAGAPVDGDPKPASAPPGSKALEATAEPSKPASAPLGSDDGIDPAGASPVGTPLGSNGLDGAPLGSPPIPDNGTVAWPWCGVILVKLKEGLSARRIYQDLCSAEHGYSGSYYSIRRLVGKLVGGHELPVRRMECDPAAEAQVDFGKGAPIIGPDGRRKGSWVFRIVLSHSRKGYSEAVLRQGTDEFLRCLENAFAHFGGCPKTLVIDNLRAAVQRADWYDPELCPKVRSFAEHYGLAILPTRPYTPRHKGKVENGVKYVKENGLKGLTFPSVGEENRHLAQWESTVADTRIHGTTRQQVIRIFLEMEQPALLPLPAGRFELFHEALRTVHRDGHVQVKGAYYSVPPEYLGQTLWARWDGRLVRLFDAKMRPIAVHAQLPPGRFSTQNAHIAPEKIHSIEKGSGWLLRQVGRIGPRAEAWAQAMLASRGIEGVRVLMGLLSLSNQHSRPQIERACEVASGHAAYHLRSLRQLIEQGQAAPVQQQFEFVDSHPIIRPVADYEQFVREAVTGQSFTSEERA